MINKLRAFLFTFDIIGPNPKLYIFNKERYQSIFSLIIYFEKIFKYFHSVKYYKFKKINDK